MDRLRFIDIGVNLGDPAFRGISRNSGRQIHPNDLSSVLNRCDNAYALKHSGTLTAHSSSQVVAQIMTGTNLEEIPELLKLAETHPSRALLCTAGLHPTNAHECSNVERYMKNLSDLIQRHKREPAKHQGIVAVGECGLDFDRLKFATKQDQLAAFAPQLQLAIQHDLPLFLHFRHSDAFAPFIEALQSASQHLSGVVHSFTGTIEEATAFIALGLYIGINGCSLKTQNNLEVVKQIPLNKLLLETDAPWCDIRPSHAAYSLLKPLLQDDALSHLRQAYVPPSIKAEKHSMDSLVKGRNEPSTIGQVAFCVAALKNLTLEQVASTVFQNTVEVFKLQDLFPQ